MFGVRVRRDSCRTIVQTQTGWDEYGQEIPIPVAPALIESDSNADWGDLVPNLTEYERLAAGDGPGDGRELRSLLVGSIDFRTALERSDSR